MLSVFELVLRITFPLLPGRQGTRSGACSLAGRWPGVPRFTPLLLPPRINSASLPEHTTTAAAAATAMTTMTTDEDDKDEDDDDNEGGSATTVMTNGDDDDRGDRF